MFGTLGYIFLRKREPRRTLSRKICCNMLILSIVIAGLGCGFSGNTAYAKEDVRSHGNLVIKEDGEETVVCTDDFTTIFDYVDSKKQEIAEQLDRLGTHFFDHNGITEYSRNPVMAGSIYTKSLLEWSVLERAIMESQNAPDNMKVLSTSRAMHLAETGELTDYYQTASSDHISNNKGMWVSGKFVVGNGADNKKAYKAGNEDGKQQRLKRGLKPIWQSTKPVQDIKHVHTYAEGSGCYIEVEKTSTSSSVCGAALEYLEPLWIPNENEEGGGSWHGGFYQCPIHNGYYSSAGTCTYVIKTSSTKTEYVLNCGYSGNQSYGTLKLFATGYSEEDESYLLLAEFDELENDSHIQWKQEQKCSWYDSNGALIGQGKQIHVRNAGMYTCQLDMTNEDVDVKSASIEIELLGFTVDN